MRMEWRRLPGPPHELEAVAPASRRRMADRGHMTTDLTWQGAGRQATGPGQRCNKQDDPRTMDKEWSASQAQGNGDGCKQLAHHHRAHCHPGRASPSPVHEGNESPGRMQQDRGELGRGRCQLRFPCQENLDDVESAPSTSTTPASPSPPPAHSRQAGYRGADIARVWLGAMLRSARAACTASSGTALGTGIGSTRAGEPGPLVPSREVQ